MNRMQVLAIALGLAFASAAQAQVKGEQVPEPPPVLPWARLANPILDFVVGDTQETTITLYWTAPSDPISFTGAAKSYDLRYSTTDPAEFVSDDAWFNEATQVSDEPAPSRPSDTQKMAIKDLLPETTYFFAIQWTGFDDVVSTLSVVVPGTTLSAGPPTSPQPTASPTVESPGASGNGGANGGCGNSAAGAGNLALLVLAGLAIAGVLRS